MSTHGNKKSTLATPPFAASEESKSSKAAPKSTHSNCKSMYQLGIDKKKQSGKGGKTNKATSSNKSEVDSTAESKAFEKQQTSEFIDMEAVRQQFEKTAIDNEDNSAVNPTASKVIDPDRASKKRYHEQISSTSDEEAAITPIVGGVDLTQV